MAMESEAEGQHGWRARIISDVGHVKHTLKGWWFWTTLAVLLLIFIILISLQVDLQWFWLVLYAAITIPFAPFVASPQRFFRGGLVDTRTDVRAMLMLAASVGISWVFAKSILNVSLLGASYGVVGAVAYMSYYISFASVAAVVFFLRTRKHYRSLPEAIHDRYGTLAVIAFGLAVAYRLYQEVWSNAIVVAGFFGAEHSKNWWLGATLSTLIPVVYAFTGGMRASLVTDAGQMVTCIGLLVGVLILLGINAPKAFGTWNSAGTCDLVDPSLSYNQCAALGQGVGNLTKSAFTYTNATCSYPTITNQTVCQSVGGTYTPTDCAIETQPLCQAAGGAWHSTTQWSLKNGADLIIVGLLQGSFSYGFFDPVLTDRAFLTEPRTMVKAFTLGGITAGLFIFFFGFLGIFGNMVAVLQPWRVSDSIFTGFKAGQPSDVSRFFGTAVFSIVNLIFITQSLSTLDSTFTSAAKLMGPEFSGLVEDGVPRPPNKASKRHLAFGRIVILVLPIIGILPLLSSPTALDATTTSGTVIMGLGPPIFALLILPRNSYNPLLFHLPFWWGVTVAIVYQLSTADCCKNSINMASWAMGDGPYASLLGVNVIGTAVAWALAAVCLLENPLGSGLQQDMKGGNNFIQAGKQAWRMARLRRRAVRGELPTANSMDAAETGAEVKCDEEQPSDDASDDFAAAKAPLAADDAAHNL